MGIITVVAPALLPLSSWCVCAVALVSLPLSCWHCFSWWAGFSALTAQASLPSLCLHCAVNLQASLPSLSWHVLSRGRRGRPRRRQRQHQRNKGNKHQHDKGGNASTMRAMMPAQRGQQCQRNWQRHFDKSRCQHDEGDNADKVVDAAMECGYNYLRLLLYASWLHMNVLKYLLMSNMDVGSSLRWLSASTLTWLHHFNSTIDHVPQNLSQVGGYNCVRLIPYAYGQHINVLKHFAISKMDAGSSLKWLSASTKQVTQNPKISAE